MPAMCQILKFEGVEKLKEEKNFFQCPIMAEDWAGFGIFFEFS